MPSKTISIVECPRDAMQGLGEFIPTAIKAEYINSLLKVGFDTVDFGSFVSPKAIPQLKDTAEVLGMLDVKNTKSKLLAIIANQRGAEEACGFEQISYLGFPFSISETFQKRNTNSTIEESLLRVQEIQSLCLKNGKKLVVYISMAFGNPYGDEWNKDIAIYWTEQLVKKIGIEIIALADTIGVSNAENIKYLFSNLIPAFPNVEIGAHLHSTPLTRREKIMAALESGCTRFDSAINGFGGCPMAADRLVGNMATEAIVEYCREKNIDLPLDLKAFEEAKRLALKVFPS